jgi:hypothetical protein
MRHEPASLFKQPDTRRHLPLLTGDYLFNSSMKLTDKNLDISETMETISMSIKRSVIEGSVAYLGVDLLVLATYQYLAWGTTTLPWHDFDLGIMKNPGIYLLVTRQCYHPVYNLNMPLFLIFKGYVEINHS